MLSLTKVSQFFGSKFFDKKRFAAGNKNSKGISLENKSNFMCLGEGKITMRLSACLGLQPYNNSGAF
jgi:hypothetical protein